ncbi:hypothetical protein ACTG15_15205 [Aeromonas sp. 164P]
MKKIIFSALMCLSLVSNAFAGGYLEAASKYKYTGWACDPDTPNYAGWVHLWRDDGIFIGALPANHNREPAGPTAVLETLVCMDLVERYHFQMIILIIKPI